MARDDPQSRIRFPAALKAQLEDCARHSNRSFNAEVIARLEASFESGTAQEALEAQVQSLENIIKDLFRRVALIEQAQKAAAYEKPKA